MTADRVTLRLKALVAYRVADPVRAATEVEDATQALYRQAQLALREVVGGRELEVRRPFSRYLQPTVRMPSVPAIGSPSTSSGCGDECAIGAPAGPEKRRVAASTVSASKLPVVRIATGTTPLLRGLTLLGKLPGLTSIETSSGPGGAASGSNSRPRSR